MSRPLISAVIPAYNRENTLTTCINGILNTSYEDFEIIIVDDGSTDNTLEVCNQIAEKHSKVRIYTQANAGVSAARNTGILHAAGEYIIFIDSDDTMFPNAIGLIAESLQDNVDLLMYTQNSTSAEEAEHLPLQTLQHAAKTRKSGNKNIISWIFEEYNPRHHDYFCVITKAFKTSIIRNNSILFKQDVSLGEDQIFVCEYLKYIQTLTFVEQAYACVLTWASELRATGLGSGLRSPENFLYNQLKNHEAINDLYQFSKLECVNNYAGNYIIDRPITRILFRHTCMAYKSPYTIRELAAFTSKEIEPIIHRQKEHISRHGARAVRFILRLICSGYAYPATIASFLYSNYKYFSSKLRVRCKK